MAVGWPMGRFGSRFGRAKAHRESLSCDQGTPLRTGSITSYSTRTWGERIMCTFPPSARNLISRWADGPDSTPLIRRMQKMQDGRERGIVRANRCSCVLSFSGSDLRRARQPYAVLKERMTNPSGIFAVVLAAVCKERFFAPLVAAGCED